MSLLLTGVRVVESASLLNGGRLGALLGDLGADVIKVERPGKGDYIRDFLGQITPHHSPVHLQVNKQKRSITLDLRSEQGREAFWRLLATADVFVDGNAADAMARLGLSYADQRKRKPDIVYCQCTGFGAEGAYAPIPTHGQMMSALAGAFPGRMEDDGLVVPDDESAARLYGRLGGGDPTAIAAVYGALYVAAALVRRSLSGEGCFIDLAAADALISNNWVLTTLRANDDRIVDRSSMPVTGGGDGAKYQFYETKDRKMLLFCAIEHAFWEHFCRAVGRDDLLDRRDERAPVDFAGGDEGLRRELQGIFHTRTLADWLEVAREHDIPMGPALEGVEALRSDPHLEEREVFVEGEHPNAGPFTYLREPGIVQGQPYTVRRPAPLLGEHSEELLSELGYGPDEVERMRAAGITSAPDDEADVSSHSGG